MAISTNLIRPEFNRGLYGTMNLYPASTAGIALGSVLTIGGDITATVITVLGYQGFKAKITGMPRGKGHKITHKGDTVTG
jgi:hypothetical protein